MTEAPNKRKGKKHEFVFEFVPKSPGNVRAFQTQKHNAGTTSNSRKLKLI